GCAVVVQQRHAGFYRHERDRGNRKEVEAADIVFAAYVKAVERSGGLAAKAGDVTPREMQADHVGLSKAPAEILGVDHRFDLVYIAAQNTSRELNRSRKRLAGRRRDGMVHGVIGEAGSDGRG